MPINDSTVARIAGNIASGLVNRNGVTNYAEVARISVAIARAIVTETLATEPERQTPTEFDLTERVALDWPRS